MRQAVDGAPAFVYNEHNKAHRAWPGTGANSPQRAQCPLRGADTEDTNVTKKKIGVLGAGTWGMALARMLCVSGNDVQVWSALPAEVENLSATRVHPNLPGMKIPEELQFTKSIEEVCTGKDVLLFAVPSVFVRSTTAKARPYIPDGQILVDVAKGMEPDTLYTMTEVMADELRKEDGPKGVKLVALSGPTHAEEVALDLPTTIVSASPDEEAARFVQDVFSNTCMRVYTNPDIKGVELSGALKNVIALGVGISTGLGYGDNARAALITRGHGLQHPHLCGSGRYRRPDRDGDQYAQPQQSCGHSDRQGQKPGAGREGGRHGGGGHQCTACRYGAGSKVQCGNAHCADGERHREGGHERQRRAAHPDGPQPEERDAAGLRKSLNFKGEGTAVCRWLCLFCCAACPLAENTK